MVGTSFGQYRIVGAIGSGGMGTVYEGEHTLIRKRAAIKVLSPLLSKDREAVDRFFNEARAAAAIEHPGIVQIFDFGFSEDGPAYIVMELLEGRSLAAELRERGRLPVVEALRVIRQAAVAIARAHEARVVHRDLKPDNIYLVPDPEVIGGRRVKILDFGVAKLGEAFNPSSTAAGAVFGTPMYMAPEQFDGRVDPRSDVYALGCVLFEALVGAPPFDGSSLHQLVLGHTSRPPASPSSKVADIPADVDALVLRCLQKDMASRFPSMDAFAAALDDSLARHAPLEPRPAQGGSLPTGGAPEQGGPPTMPGAPDPPRKPPGAGDTVDRDALGGGGRGSRFTRGGLQRQPPKNPGPAKTMFTGLPRDERPEAPPEPTASPEPSTIPPQVPPAERSLAVTMLISIGDLASENGPPPMPEPEPRRVKSFPEPPGERRRPKVAGTAPIPREAEWATESALDDDLEAVFESVVPDALRDALPFLVEFFGGLFTTARPLAARAVELGKATSEDLASRSHYVLFLEDINLESAAPLGELSTIAFRASVAPLAVQLAAIEAPPGSLLIAILAASQLGQGAREAIFELRKERNLFVVPIAASEIRRACEAGTAQLLLADRIADLHTVSDPFTVLENFTDPTRCIGFAAEVADLVKHITVGGKIVSVAGPPGSGKTSVVAMAEYGCDTSNVSRRFVRLQSGELTSFEPAALLQELHERLHGDGESGPRLSRGSTPPETTGEAIVDLRATIMQLGVRAAALREPERQATPTVEAARRHQLVIVLEDADWLIRLASTFEPDTVRRQRARELWRGLAQLCSSGGHTVIVTSVRDFQVMDQMPLERPVSVSRVPMRALNRRESDRLVVSLGELVGFSPSRRALAKLHGLSGGNVYALRLLCSNVIRAMRERPGYSPLARLEVTARLVDDAARHIAATGSTFRPHVSVWLDDIERVVLQHVARERPRSPRQIRRALEGSAGSEQIVKALDGLELMGLVESRRGRHRVRIPLFERWIETHLDPPQRRLAAINQARASRIAVGCTVTALLFGAYWTWLRSTRSAASKPLGECTFQLDYPDRIGSEESFELFVYQNCRTPALHQLAVEPVLSSLRIPAATSDCTTTTASCTAIFNPIAGHQAGDIYRVQLLVDGTSLLAGAIDKDGFAALRTVGEKTVPALAFLPLLLSLGLAFHKDMKRYVSMAFQRGGAPPPTPPAGPLSEP